MPTDGAASVQRMRSLDTSSGESLTCCPMASFILESSISKSAFQRNGTELEHNFCIPGNSSMSPGVHLFSCAANPAILWTSFFEEGVEISRKVLNFSSVGDR